MTENYPVPEQEKNAQQIFELFEKLRLEKDDTTKGKLNGQFWELLNNLGEKKFAVLGKWFPNGKTGDPNSQLIVQLEVGLSEGWLVQAQQPESKPKEKPLDVEELFGIDEQNFSILITNGTSDVSPDFLTGGKRVGIEDSIVMDDANKDDPTWQLKDREFLKAIGFVDVLSLENCGIHGGLGHNINLIASITHVAKDDQGITVKLEREKEKDTVIYSKQKLVSQHGSDDGIAALVAGAKASGWDNFHINTNDNVEKLIKTARAFIVNDLELDEQTQTAVVAAIEKISKQSFDSTLDDKEKWEKAKEILIRTVPGQKLDLRPAIIVTPSHKSAAPQSVPVLSGPI